VTLEYEKQIDSLKKKHESSIKRLNNEIEKLLGEKHALLDELNQNRNVHHQNADPLIDIVRSKNSNSNNNKSNKLNKPNLKLGQANQLVNDNLSSANTGKFTKLINHLILMYIRKC
jgi:hypothetical protein